MLRIAIFRITNMSIRRAKIKMGTIGKLPFKKQALKDILLLVNKFINRFTSDRRIEQGV